MEGHSRGRMRGLKVGADNGAGVDVLVWEDNTFAAS